MADQSMREILARLDAQEAELAALRAERRRRRLRAPGGQRGRLVALAALALLVALVPLSVLAVNPFTDLKGTVHDPDIDTIYNLGITTGCSETEYCPERNVSRQEMASFLARTAALNRMAFVSRSAAGPDENIGTANEKEYMNVQLTVPGRTGDTAMLVRVSFTGYVFARSAPVGNASLLRGEIRLEGETAAPARIVTRSVVGANPLAIVGNASATPAIAAAERLDFSGSRVFTLAPGTYTFRMFLVREVGTAQDVGFGFGNMQAETIAFGGTGARVTVPSGGTNSAP